MVMDICHDTGEVLVCHRHPFSRVRVQTHCVGESMTHQSHADACDINKILARYDRTGELPTGQPGQFADVTELQGDFTELVEKSRATIRKARKSKVEDQPALEGLDNPTGQPAPAASSAPTTPEA